MHQWMNSEKTFVEIAIIDEIVDDCVSSRRRLLPPRVVSKALAFLARKLEATRFVSGRAGYRRFLRHVRTEGTLRCLYLPKRRSTTLQQFIIHVFRDVLNSFVYGDIFNCPTKFDSILQIDGGNAFFLNLLIPKFYDCCTSYRIVSSPNVEDEEPVWASF